MRRIMGLRGIEEEAEFWDTHDTEEFPDEFEKVEVKFARPLQHKWLLVIEFENETFSRLNEMAQEADREPGALIRTWVLEHLQS